MKFRTLIFGFTILFTFQNLEAQSTPNEKNTLEGQVTDKNQKPLRGALIYVDSVSTGVRTDHLGKYVVKVDSTNQILSVYSRDYGITDFSYSGEAIMDFELSKLAYRTSKNDVEKKGYKNPDTDKKKKRKKEPTDYTKYRDIYQLLVAEIPGAQVTGKVVRLRGTSVSSVNSGLTPLYIVDGTTVSSIDFINTMDVKSVKAIRDESATLYGSRGANGIIIIELKK